MSTEKPKTSLASSAGWLLFAKIIGFGLSFMLPLLIVRYLVPEQIGIYQQVFKILANTCVILTLGFSMSAYYYLAREPETKPYAVFNILFFNFVMGGLAFLTFFFYPQLLGSIFQSSEITRLLPILGVVVWVWIISSILETVVLANQETKIATIFIVLAQFSKTLFMICGVVLFSTVDSLIYAALIQGIFQLILLLGYLHSRFPTFWFSFSWKFFREHAIYALPFGVSGLIWTLQIDIHNYFVSSRFTPAEFAVYSYGCFQLPLITMLAESVTGVMIPRMSELQLKGEKREMIELTAKAMQKLSLFYFPAYGFLAITAYTFITTLFTEKFADSVPIFQINLILVPFYILVTDPIARAYKEIGKFLFVFRLIVFAIIVSVLWFAIQHFSLTGMIKVVVVITLLELIVVSVLVLHKIGVKLSDIYLLKNVWFATLSTLFAGFFTHLVYINTRDFVPVLTETFSQTINSGFAHFIAGSLIILLTGTIFVVLYIIGIIYLGAISDSEKEFARRKLSIVTKYFRPNLNSKLVTHD